MGSGVGRVNKGKGSHKRAKRKRFLARAVDQIAEDMSDPLKAEALRTDQPIDFDLPGMGQFYCVECARYFISDKVLSDHCRTKLHKNRLKELKETPYSQAEAEAAAGMAPNDTGLHGPGGI
jgi:bud site selection protein 20